ncbi:hypothetical protein [Paracoccus sp. APAP_BH8]|uniref:hypothetical protein n=1 Tax=Paracoccus sp. APAP_BH8 TaxID=3110237 RepID=UPI003FA77256
MRSFGLAPDRPQTTCGDPCASRTEAAHAVGASVEGELGVLGSLETGEAAAEDGSGAEARGRRQGSGGRLRGAQAEDLPGLSSSSACWLRSGRAAWSDRPEMKVIW